MEASTLIFSVWAVGMALTALQMPTIDEERESSEETKSSMDSIEDLAGIKTVQTIYSLISVVQVVAWPCFAIRAIYCGISKAFRE